MPKSAQHLPDRKSLAEDKGINLEIYQCSGCGLVQITNEPVHYHKEVIRAVGISEEMRVFREKQFKQFIDKYSLKGKKVIEIGCGRGDYLSIINQLDVVACGIEYSAESVKHCSDIGLNVIKGFVDSQKNILPDAPFDAFYMFSFLEHLPDPNAALRGINYNIVEDGIGIIEVPNLDMILRRNLFSEFIADHIVYFMKDTLNLILDLNGFEVIECNEIWHDYIISAVVRKKKALDISHFKEHQNKIRNELNNYINQFGYKKVAVWGAGHQALAVISLTGLSEKIKYVIDSADFKQGKYTPATHLKIVSPDILEVDPVDAVIIIAGSYSDEVADILRRKTYGKTDITILREYGLQML
jgi:SAM-dependent methyltransferase